MDELQKAQAEIARLNGIIEQKNQDIVGIRRKYKPLKEMTDDEKAALTAEDLARKEEQDLLFEDQEKLKAEQADLRAKEVAERKTNLAKKIAGNDPKIMEKVLANFDKIKGAETAYTETELAPFMDLAVNMLGDERPAPVHAAINGSGGVAPLTSGDGKVGDFADTDAGKSLAQALGLPVEQAPAPAAPAVPAPAPITPAA